MLHIVSKFFKHTHVDFVRRRICNWFEFSEVERMGPVPKLGIMQIFIDKGFIGIVLGDLFRIDYFATITQLGMNIIFVVVFSAIRA